MILRRLDDLLAAVPAPRRLLVQWVPHGFGYHSMNVWFCLWLAKSRQARRDIELMVHEPYLEFRRGPVRHALMACVHRLMTMVLLGAARKVWISIPAWERLLRPYALGRTVPMQWLPVPGCVAERSAASAAAIRLKYVADGQHLLGHFGSYGAAVTSLLFERLPHIMEGDVDTVAVAARCRQRAVSRGARRTLPVVERTGPRRGVSVRLRSRRAHRRVRSVCQPYSDGITSRRTSAMACLSRGRPVVTTSGHLTEPLWAETRAVEIVEVGDSAAFARASSACSCTLTRGRNWARVDSRCMPNGSRSPGS